MIKEKRIEVLERLQKTGTPYKHDEIIYKDEKRMLPVYEIPLEALNYNKYNGRILSMVKSFERQFRVLNPDVIEDRTVIENFLWESKVDRNKTTMADLEKWGQKRIGIVTKDGIIIDGNRRARLLNKLGKSYFKAVILDDTMEDNPRGIMELETTYQMGEDEKLDYNPIEKYLKCKDLRELGFSNADIGKMMAEKESRIAEWISIMELMDSYLNDLGYNGIYTRLDKREGQFVDLNKYLKKYENGTALVDWNYKKSDIADLKAICFDYIRAKYEGKEFRAVALPSKQDTFFCKGDVWEKFRDEHFDNIDPINNSEKTIEDIVERNPEGDLSVVLKVRDEDWTEKSFGLMKGNLNKSLVKIDELKESNAPLKLLLRASSTLDSINTDIEAFYNDEAVLTLVKEISSKAWGFQQSIKKSRK